MIRIFKTLKINESGYFRWARRGKTARELEDELLVTVIRKAHEESKCTYGATRIKAKLERLGAQCSLGRIRR